MRLGLHIRPDPELVSEYRLGCCQIFAGNPSSYSVNTHASEKKYGVPTYIHCSYPVFLTVRDPDKQRVMRQYFNTLCPVANAMDANLVVHVGTSYGDVSGATKDAISLADYISERLNGVLLLENGAGKPSLVGPSEALLEIFARCQRPFKLGACFDTAHGWGNGKYYGEFLQKALPFLRLVHLNGSTVPFGSGRDLHSWMYQGRVEFDTTEFWEMLQAANVDVVLEGSGEEGDLVEEIVYVKDKLSLI